MKMVAYRLQIWEKYYNLLVDGDNNINKLRSLLESGLRYHKKLKGKEKILALFAAACV